jgi:hypothetical protein
VALVRLAWLGAAVGVALVRLAWLGAAAIKHIL